MPLLPPSPIALYLQQLLLAEDRAAANGNTTGHDSRRAEIARARAAQSAVADATMDAALDEVATAASTAAAAAELLTSRGVSPSLTLRELLLEQARYWLGESIEGPAGLAPMPVSRPALRVLDTEAA